MKTVLFLDYTAPKPYDPQTLATEGMGGTEASVIRIAEGLANQGQYSVIVAQHNRNEDAHGKAYYTYPAENDGITPDYIVCLRDPRVLLEARRRFPQARLILWCHDLATRDLGLTLPILFETGVEALVCVSNYHRTQIVETIKPFGYEGQFPIKVIYNPIDDDLLPDATPVDKNKLVFFSSPHKGLNETLQIFKALNEIRPNLSLYVSNPGYLLGGDYSLQSVHDLGSLPHAAILSLVRSSLAVLYCNRVFPETFGLVFAEANAVGTPVLTHNLGAAKEVLDDNPYQIVDCSNPKAVIERVLDWHDNGRPTVRGKSQFRLTRVVNQWLNLLKA